MKNTDIHFFMFRFIEEFLPIQLMDQDWEIRREVLREMCNGFRLFRTVRNLYPLPGSELRFLQAGDLPRRRWGRTRIRTRAVVNFTNILQAALRQYSYDKKLQSQTVIREKLQKHYHTKKLIPDDNGNGDSAFLWLELGQFPSHETEIDRFESFKIKEGWISDSNDEAGFVDAFIGCHLWNEKI